MPAAGSLPAASARMRLGVLVAALLVSATLVSWLVARRTAAPQSSVVAMSVELRTLYRAQQDDRPLAIWSGTGDPPPLLRLPLDEHIATLLYPMLAKPGLVYDERLHLHRAPNLDQPRGMRDGTEGTWYQRSNSLGMREDTEPAQQQPDLRILVTGASNVEAVCNNADSATNVLESRLLERYPGRTIEALNAGGAGYNFYNFLAVLERYLELDPDVFVIVAYGGNDFFGNARLYRYFNSRGPANEGPHTCDGALEIEDQFVQSLLGTEVAQAVYYRNNPDDFAFTLEVACSALDEIAKLCRANDIELVCAYLPPPMRGQPALFGEIERTVSAAIGQPPASFDISDRLADGWLAFLEQRGIAHIDLRPRFKATESRLYWLVDSHVNTAGQRVIAQELFPLVERAIRGRPMLAGSGSEHRVDEGRDPGRGLQEDDHDRGGQEDAQDGY